MRLMLLEGRFVFNCYERGRCMAFRAVRDKSWFDRIGIG